MNQSAAAALPACLAGSAAASPPPQDSHHAARPGSQTADDEILAAKYVCMRSIATGRKLRPGVRLAQLDVAGLVEFWDSIPSVTGRHAAPDFGATGEAR